MDFLEEIFEILLLTQGDGNQGGVDLRSVVFFSNLFQTSDSVWPKSNEINPSALQKLMFTQLFSVHCEVGVIWKDFKTWSFCWLPSFCDGENCDPFEK